LPAELSLSMEKSIPRVTWLHKLASLVGSAYLHLVDWTSFVEKDDHPAFLEYRRKRLRGIYAFWHNSQVYLAYAHRGEKVGIMVSLSKDGEYIAQVMNRLGLEAVRGSSSRGGEGAMRDVMDRLEQGAQVGFTPDGPRGPVQRIHPGVVLASQHTGSPIFPVTYSSRRKLVFRSWDKFYMPLPFTHIVVAHGRPFVIDKQTEPELAKETVRSALNDVNDSAAQLVKKAPYWGTEFVGAGLLIAYRLLSTVLLPLVLPLLGVRYGWRRSFQHLRDRFAGGEVSPAQKRRIWFHSASVGEWQALKPVLKEIRGQGDFDCLLTVSTPEARRLVEKDEPALSARMLPFDTPWIIRRWLNKTKPDAVVIVETELWANLLEQLSDRDVPVFIINGRLSERSLRRWRLAFPLARRMVRRLSGVYARSQSDALRYAKLGVEPHRIEVTGNTKCDNLVVSAPGHRAELRNKLFKNDQGFFVVAGSTWTGEEISILKLLDRDHSSRLRLVLAPRRPERFSEVAGLLKGRSWSSWKEVKAGGHQWTSDILLVDTLGDLRILYQAADVGITGGSFVRGGGQNPLEPAAARTPVLFGPNMQNFSSEAEALKRAGGARQARNEGDLLRDVEELIADESLRFNMGEAAAACVQQMQGGAAKTANDLLSLLGWQPGRVK